MTTEQGTNRNFALEVIDSIANGEINPASVDWRRVGMALAKLDAQRDALAAALEACAQEAEGWNTLSVNVAAIRIERIARDALAAARGDA